MDYFIVKNSVLLSMVTVAFALWAVLVYGDEIKRHWRKLAPFGYTVEDMTWLKELTQHLAFYGGSLGYFFGGGQVFGKVLAVGFTVACLWASLLLKANIKNLGKSESNVEMHKE